KCEEIIVLHLGYLNYTQYQVAVSFKGLENVSFEIKVAFVVGVNHFIICVLSLLLMVLLVTRYIMQCFPPSLEFISALSGKHTIQPSLKWKSGSGLSLWF
ncbi:hypothetical protein XENOCAPTIV_010791, partial [Xenoophorus captivus]